MLTPEQIKNLKPGDPIVIHTKFQYADEDGDVKFVAPYSRDGGSFCFISSKFVSLPSEYKTVVDARDVFRNMSESEKASISNFLSSYFRESKKQEEMLNSLKKMGIDLTNIQPKHDPCRPFREGDVVEPKQVKGRVYSKDSKHLIGKKCIVFRDEEEPGYVVISYAGKNYSINAAYLGLITPVEELEPYHILHNMTNGYVIYKDEPKTDNIVVIFNNTHPHAKAAAEAECGRLNEEWRNEQSND